MELNHTCVEILKILYNEQDYVSIADLSERLGKTERSVRYNLDIVDKYLQQHGLPFTEREFARGIKLKVTPEVSTVLHDYLSVSTPYQYKFSTEERIRYLEICLLLGHKRYTPIADMARQLVVSYGTISTDLAAVEDWMNAHRLTMERKSRMGIRICGSEDLIRTVCLDRLNESISLQEYERYLCGNPLENKVSLLIFSELFCELDVSFFRELPKQAESVLCRVFSDDSFGKMIFALAIMTQRRRSGVAGPMVSPSDEELHAPSEEQSAAQSMLDQIGQRYHVTFTEGDRISLTERLLSSKCILSGCATLGRDSRRRKKMASVADQIVANIERLYQISFGEDRQGLVERLMVHLTPTTYRIRFHKSIVNPLYATYLKCEGKDYRTQNLLSLSGVYQPKKELSESKVPIALSTYLKENPQIKTVVLHLDNDKTGRLCTAALTELLKKDYEIVDSPPPVGKDVNDFLMSYLGLTRQKPVRERSDVR